MFSCQLPGTAINCYVPSEMLTAYNIQPLLNAGFTGAGKTIVIIDAFGDPTTGLGSPNGMVLVDDLLKFVSPFDGLIGIVESGPLPGTSVSSQGKQRPH